MSEKPPMRLEYPGVSLSLTPEAVRLNDLVLVHACLTRSLVQCFQRDDPESLPAWVEEVIAALLHAP